MLTIFYIYIIYKYIYNIYIYCQFLGIFDDWIFLQKLQFFVSFSCFSVHVHQSSRDILVASEEKLHGWSPSKEKLCGQGVEKRVELRRHVKRLLRAWTCWLGGRASKVIVSSVNVYFPHPTTPPFLLNCGAEESVIVEKDAFIEPYHVGIDTLRAAVLVSCIAMCFFFSWSHLLPQRHVITNFSCVFRCVKTTKTNKNYSSFHRSQFLCVGASQQYC